MEREAVLMKIKAAEAEARARRERAEQQAESVKEKAAREAASIVATAEKEGRKIMQDTLDATRSKEEEMRATRLAEADGIAAALKKEAAARKSQVIESVAGIFMREYDVQN